MPEYSSNPFEQIVDDGDSAGQSKDWAMEQIAEGREPSDVAADLAAAGWTADQAEQIAEQARQALRSRHAGASLQATREKFGVGDPRVARSATPFAQPSPFGALGNLCRALFRFWSLKPAKPSKKK